MTNRWIWLDISVSLSPWRGSAHRENRKLFWSTSGKIYPVTTKLTQILIKICYLKESTRHMQSRNPVCDDETPVWKFPQSHKQPTSTVLFSNAIRWLANIPHNNRRTPMFHQHHEFCNIATTPACADDFLCFLFGNAAESKSASQSSQQGAWFPSVSSFLKI